ncbi:hypothetical protein [Oceaniglobus ichthyenteri]|uniref:hypothetical protein n=1 Tax=Oceaniglobus ichthyenteri TaxID=2136177 RepID=UPI000F820AAC|nr:hypothetical protein [Oceaniglobus ichthyenteri]
MALRLKSRELPMVQFRAVLPEWLGPGGECFIEIDARAGGAINSAYVASAESLMLRARIMDRKTRKVTDDAEYVAADNANAKAIGRGRFETLYDSCVIEWRSNILTEDDDGKAVPITCDRATFVELSDQPIPEIAKALTQFESKVLDAGKMISQDDEETVKN